MLRAAKPPFCNALCTKETPAIDRRLFMFLEQAPLLQRGLLPFRHIQTQHLLEVASQDSPVALRGVGLVAAQDGLRGQRKDAAQIALEAFRRGEVDEGMDGLEVVGRFEGVAA